MLPVSERDLDADTWTSAERSQQQKLIFLCHSEYSATAKAINSNLTVMNDGRPTGLRTNNRLR